MLRAHRSGSSWSALPQPAKAFAAARFTTAAASMIEKCDGMGEPVREVLDLGPLGARDQRRDAVNTLAAGQHRKGREPDRLQDVAEVEGGGPHRLEVEALVGVEVEHEAIGLLDVLNPRAPAMEHDCAHLHMSQQPLRHRDTDRALRAKLDWPERRR